MLRQLGHKFPAHEHPELLVGLSRADDAAVYKLNDDQAIVQTLDFFAPTVDDPYQYGAIAAANALNDVYAMGGDVLFALNIAAFPEDLPIDVVARILEGGADKVKEAGGVIAGGHTIIDAEPKYGLAVTGIVHPSRIRTNAAAQPADVILLTKPLGTGILLTAITERTASPAHEQTAIEQMMALTKTAAELTREFDVHAITDVTGFGLAGHLMEVATNSDVCVELSLATLPPMDGLAGYVERGYSTGGQARNREYFLPELQTERALSVYEETLLLDPQTCGGLLIVLPDAHAAKLERRLTEAGVPNWRIGSVEPGAGVRIRD